METATDVIRSDIISTIGPIESAIEVIKSDILFTLDHGLRIFEGYTREDCAISIVSVKIQSGIPEFTTDLRRGFGRDS
jgi:hypothetical protein